MVEWNEPLNFTDALGFKCDETSQKNRKKRIKTKGKAFTGVMEKVGKKAMKRGGVKAVIAGVLALIDGPAPVGDAIALLIMGTEAKALAEDLEAIQDKVQDIRSEIDDLIKCKEQKSDNKENGGKVEGKGKTQLEKCSILEGKPQSNGSYHGGRHKILQKGGNTFGRQSHHMPPMDAYPKGTSRENLPAIQIDTIDHKETYSHGHKGNKGKVYRYVQKKLLENDLLPIAMAMDILDIRSIADPNDKYDDAIGEMLAWSICMKKI